MRSRMGEGMPGRCPQCFLRLDYCACAQVKPLPTRTRFLILRHPHESYKSTNSARWAALGLTRCEIHTHLGRGKLDLTLLEGPDTWLLFPGAPVATAQPPTGGPQTVLVLDGTWRQVRRMLNHLPPLQALPRLALTEPRGDGPRLRSNQTPRHLSTLEAIALALEQLEGADTAAPLWELNARMVEGTRRARGTHRPLAAEDDCEGDGDD